MRTSGGARERRRDVSSSLPCMGPSASSRSSEKSRANTSTVNTRGWRVRRVGSASWCGSWGGAGGVGGRGGAQGALAAGAAATAAAEWLGGSAGAGAGAGGAAGVAATLLALVRMPSPRRRPSLRLVAPAAVALACLIVGATLVRGVLQVQRIECCWPDVRAGRLPRDSSALKGTLAAAVAEARRPAGRGLTAALLAPQAAFEPLRDGLRSR